MADFCKDCSLEHFEEDFGDLAGICAPNQEALVLCEGCGPCVVDHNGKRIRKATEEEAHECFGL